MESKRPGTAFVDDPSIFVDQIDSIRPAGVRLLCAVAKVVDQRRELDSQLANTHPGYRLAFVKTLGAGKNDFIADVALHLPHVTGMGFENINGVELDARSILLVQLVESGDLPPEWRSGITPEDEHDRMIFPNRR
jgi:hypothetical protein